ncbi:hypothetical protein TcBrA4_0107710 [Trypanosoma cruzi]|nr:hypothetical protein TcBrA4_0107710 [Trypanosoma cruzi]
MTQNLVGQLAAASKCMSRHVNTRISDGLLAVTDPTTVDPESRIQHGRPTRPETRPEFAANAERNDGPECIQEEAFLCQRSENISGGRMHPGSCLSLVAAVEHVVCGITRTR